MEKNVVIYWCEFRGKKSNLLSFLGSKKKVYLEVFDEISKEAQVALVFGKENYLGGLRFKNYYLYQDGEFHRKNREIKADAVLDRSRSLKFPRRSKRTNHKVLNQLDFKIMVSDKWDFYKKFEKFSPKSYYCPTRLLIRRTLKNFDHSEKIVVKPRHGLKGQGIIIGTKEEILGSKIKYPVIIQEFTETKNFFIKNHRSDLRLVVIDGKPVYAVVRTPKKGSMLANVAQGGSIKEVDLSDLPDNLLKTANRLAAKIKKEYQNPFYSIDFGITSNGFVIFEMNNFIGFPLIGRKNQDQFVSGLAKVLIEKAKL